jgi:hypothetical protein
VILPTAGLALPWIYLFHAVGDFTLYLRVAYRYKDQPLASRANYSNHSPLSWRITTSTTSQRSTSYLGERCSKLGTEVGLLTSVCSTLVDVIRIRVTESSDERDFYIPEDMLVR